MSSKKSHSTRRPSSDRGFTVTFARGLHAESGVCPIARSVVSPARLLQRPGQSPPAEPDVYKGRRVNKGWVVSGRPASVRFGSDVRSIRRSDTRDGHAPAVCSFVTTVPFGVSRGFCRTEISKRGGVDKKNKKINTA